MTRKLKVNTKAVPDAHKPRDPVTLLEHFDPPLFAPPDQEDNAADVSDEEKGGVEALKVGDTTIAGDHVRTASPKDLRRLASSLSKAPDNAEGTSVSPVKRKNPVVVTTTHQVMEAHAEVINQLLDKGTQTHLDLAKACLKARDEVGRKSYNDFVPMLHMSKAEFSKYCAIGKKSLLHDAGLRNLMPTSFSSLYVISMLADDDLRRLVDEGKINPQSTRSELEDLLPATKRIAEKEIRSLPRPWFAVIELDSECDDTVRHDVHTALAKLKSSKPAIVRVVDLIDLDEAERQRQKEREHQIFLKQLRLLVKKEVRHAGKTTMKGVHKKEELKIANDADERRLREVLLLAQREGKYEELLEQAKREIKLTGSPSDDEQILQNL